MNEIIALCLIIFGPISGKLLVFPCLKAEFVTLYCPLKTFFITAAALERIHWPNYI